MSIQLPRSGGLLSRSAAVAAGVALTTLLAACGGGGSDGTVTVFDPPASPAPPAGPLLSGIVSKGPVLGAVVCVYAVGADGARGAAIVATTVDGGALPGGCAASASDGSFNLRLPAGTSGEVVLEATGGTYCSNEATYDSAGQRCGGSGGTPVALGANVLRSLATLRSDGGIALAPLTPFTTAALSAAQGAGRLSAAALDTQFAALATRLGLPQGLSATTPPTDATMAALLAAVSQVVGTDAAALARVLAGLGDGTLVLRNGAFVVAGAPGGGGQAVVPTVDSTGCTGSVTAGTASQYYHCGATALANGSTTLNSPSRGNCSISISGGVITVSNGSSTVSAAFNGDTDDTLTYAGGVLLGVDAADRGTDANSTVNLTLDGGRLSSATASRTSKNGGANVLFQCSST